jgi:protein gp37
MGANTAIQWTAYENEHGASVPGYTFNPWIGCTEVGPECDNCYAREGQTAKMRSIPWGPGQKRHVTSEHYWNDPRRWNRAAVKLGVRPRVFCASLADIFDDDAPTGQLARLWALIQETPQLDWLLLTKRANRIAERLPATWGIGWANVWLGVSVGVRKSLWRLDCLRSVPAVVRFVSFEPLLEMMPRGMDLRGIDWGIIGGESGGGARAFDVSYAFDVIEQLHAAGAAAFMKQLGVHPVAGLVPLPTKHKKGGDPSEWPDVAELAGFPRAQGEALRVREFPVPRKGLRHLDPSSLELRFGPSPMLVTP